MNKEKLKLLISNIEMLLDELKSEVYSNVDAYKPPQYEQVSKYLTDYDEIFEDDDGYPD
jgi:uncharacterized protein VirK/YbjX